MSDVVSQRILFVDDETALRDWAREEFNHFCQEVEAEWFEAADGLEAWKIIQAQPISVIISDFKMPNLNGEELLSKVRGAGRRTPFILLTGFPEELDYQYANSLEALVISKPLRAQAIAKLCELMELGLGIDREWQALESHLSELKSQKSLSTQEIGQYRSQKEQLISIMCSKFYQSDLDVL